AITWSMAQRDGLDVEFGETCDRESGLVAIPFLFRTECFAAVADNGGATTPGVTADSIKVVAWLPAEDDPVRSLVLRRVGFDASNAELREAYAGFVEIFQRTYQTYGRTVQLEFVEASGSILDNTAARADAVRAAEDLDAFAVLGGPIIGSAWTEELHARGVVCIACPGISEPEPTVFTVPPTGGQIRDHLTAYVAQKLGGETARYAGEELRGEERVFGLLQLGMGESDERSADRLRDQLAEEGVELAEQILYPLDPGRAAELATNAVTRMQAAGVTTVLVQADPILLPAFTQEATKQRWFPEWVLGGSPFIDTTAFARTFDQEQWRHAFGISYFPPPLAPAANPPSRLYEWFHGAPPPVDGALPLLLVHPQVTLFFTGLQHAGPNLTAQTFRDGLFAMPPTPRAVTQPTVSYGDHRWDDPDYAGIDDMVELWWDADAEGPDEAGAQGKGVYRYVDGARRYLVDEWTGDLAVFDESGSVTTIEELPPDERPPDYPLPT
ncbi:MAG: ABC transporter substrate-binding protein, partial [Actinomycetota bacterium]